MLTGMKGETQRDINVIIYVYLKKVFLKLEFNVRVHRKSNTFYIFLDESNRYLHIPTLGYYVLTLSHR